MICKLCVGILSQIIVTVYVHFPLPLGGIPYQRFSSGAERALCVTIATHAVMSVIENFEMREIILYQLSYSSYRLRRNRATPSFCFLFCFTQ